MSNTSIRKNILSSPEISPAIISSFHHLCICGSIILKTGVKRHLLTKKHKKFEITYEYPEDIWNIIKGYMITKKVDEIRKASTTSSYVEICSHEQYYSARKESMDFHQSYPEMFKLHSIWSNSSMGEYRILECDTFIIIPDANIPNDVYDKSVKLKKEVKYYLEDLERNINFTRKNLNAVSLFNILDRILFRIAVADEDEKYMDAEYLANRELTLTYQLRDKLEQIKQGRIIKIIQTPAGIDFHHVPY